MYEYQGNVLCIHGSWLIEQGIVTYDYFKKLCQRKQLEKINVGGNGRKALIKFETIKQDIKEKIIAITGDPTEKAKHITFIDYIKIDTEAEKFFNEYTLENKEGLPEKNIKEYIANAEVLNAIDTIVNSTLSKRKALGSKVRPWPKIAEVVAELPQKKWPHSLPANPRRLQDRLKLYKADGYQSLVHKGFCHKNSEKLDDDAKRWVLARWADQVNKCATHMQLFTEYNKLAITKEWKTLKTEQTLINFLQDPKIEPLWYGYRYGELKSKEKYSYQFSTILSGMRDSLWYSDGTKLNYYYQDATGKMKTCQVYEVFDVYSEVFIGYHISDSEDFEAQYRAYKMAVQIAGHKPYEIKYDNQGGTKTLESKSFLGKLARLCSNTRPYNGKSKTIESAFGRFQQQHLKKEWFFTGQNIQAKDKESKANMEFILANAKNLPTLDEVKEVYAKRRREWNEAAHHATGVSKIEMYLNSVNPATPAIQIWDMIDMFWIERKDTVTCTAYGITYTENNKKDKYTYMVYDENDMPDLAWLRNNIDKKFVIKYDPDDRSTIQLYENTPLGLRHAGIAQIKINVHRGRQEQEAWEASYITQIINADKTQRVAERDRMEDILKEQGRSAEDYGLRSPLIKGVESSRKKQKAAKKEATDIGEYQKELSNAVADVNDIYSHM